VKTTGVLCVKTAGVFTNIGDLRGGAREGGPGVVHETPAGGKCVKTTGVLCVKTAGVFTNTGIVGEAVQGG